MLSPVSVQAASGEVVLMRVMNDVPNNKRCSTALIRVYNAPNAPVKSVSILFKGSYDPPYGKERWQFINISTGPGSRKNSWRTYPVYLRPGQRMTLRRWVCAIWVNPGPYGMSVRGVGIRWTWY